MIELQFLLQIFCPLDPIDFQHCRWLSEVLTRRGSSVLFLLHCDDFRSSFVNISVFILMDSEAGIYMCFICPLELKGGGMSLLVIAGSRCLALFLALINT